MIVDANVATYWFVETPLTRQAKNFLSRQDLLAPNLLRIEVAGAMLKFLRAKMISDVQVMQAIDHIDGTIAEFVDDASLLKRAIEVSISSGHKIYDCLYLALALERREPFATADRRLAVLAQTLGIEVLLIEPAESG